MVATKKQKKNLKPAKPGEVRNPCGRKKGIPNARTVYDRILKTKGLVKVGDKTIKGTRLHIMAAMKVHSATNPEAPIGDRIRASDSIENRIWGKPEQPLSAVKDTEVFLSISGPEADI